jgi:hypothetical protein
MGYWLVISSLAQSLWVILFQLRFFPLSVLAMIAILLPLIVLYLRLDIALTPVSSQQRWLVNIPLSIYLGWISVATIVNVALALYHICLKLYLGKLGHLVSNGSGRSHHRPPRFHPLCCFGRVVSLAVAAVGLAPPASLLLGSSHRILGLDLSPDTVRELAARARGNGRLRDWLY